ncbi:Chitinase [hydrothermal vent metagenome]|uniref:Chitinase n=1 Tax=hydrothermal vent metagenome TaxID=652676 RepID=A0A1W1BSL2_9ZZZZ
MNKITLLLFIILTLNFTGCGSSSEEGKKLLSHNLKLVGIPPEIVVNICQDKNDNGSCDEGELQAKVSVSKGATIAKMWKEAKVQFDENNIHILENYNPTISIIMEIDGQKHADYKNVDLALKYKPVTHELSVLQAVVDADFLKEEEVKKLKKLDNREKLDFVLLTGLMNNQQLLKDENLSTETALAINLEEIAKGLKDLNVSKELPEELEACENNTTCIDGVLGNATEEVELTQEEAKDLAQSKKVADGYIVKLSTPVVATCADGKEYNSSLFVKEKGQVDFENLPLDIDCNLTVSRGAIIDSNNNNKLDIEDKALEFDMIGSANDTFITPLTTLLHKKSGEDIEKFERMIQNFDPVIAPSRLISNTGVEKVKIEKLIILMEVLKTAMKADLDIKSLDLSGVIKTSTTETIKDFDINKLIASFPEDKKDFISKKANAIRDLVLTLKNLDPAKISFDTFFVSLSDGGKNIEKALKTSLLIPLPKGITITEFIVKSGVEKNPFTGANFPPFTKSKSVLHSAINVLDKMDIESDDIQEKLNESKAILNGANAKDNDAQVGKALFDLAEITNSEVVGDLIKVKLDGKSVARNSHLEILIENNDDKDLELELLSNITDLSGTSMTLIHNIVEKLTAIENTLAKNFVDPSYVFSYDDFNITNNQSKLLRVSILSIASKLEYLTAFDYTTFDDVKTRTTVLNGVSAEYTNIDSNPLPIFKRSGFGALNSSVGAKRLANSKALFLKALDILNSVDEKKEDEDDQEDIVDAKKEVAPLKASLNGTKLYRDEREEDGVTVIYDIDLSALYSASTALDLTHTMGHDLEYESKYNYYDSSTNKEYSSGSYNQAFSRFYNEPMAKEWIAKDGSIRSYVNGSIDRPTLDVEYNSIPTGSNSHIPSIVKKIEIKGSGKATITHTGDNVLKYLFNDLDIDEKYNSESILYKVERDDYLIVDETIRYGIEVLNGNVEIINPDPIKGEATVKVKSGFTGEQCFQVKVHDTLGHYETLGNCIYINDGDSISSIYDSETALDKLEFPQGKRYSLGNTIVEYNRISNPDVVRVSEYDLNSNKWVFTRESNYYFEGNEYVVDSDKDGYEDYRMKLIERSTDINRMNNEADAEIFSAGAEGYRFVVKHTDGRESYSNQVNETALNQYLEYISSQD